MYLTTDLYKMIKGAFKYIHPVTGSQRVKVLIKGSIQIISLIDKKEVTCEVSPVGLKPPSE